VERGRGERRVRNDSGSASFLSVPFWFLSRGRLPQQYAHAKGKQTKKTPSPLGGLAAGRARECVGGRALVSSRQKARALEEWTACQSSARRLSAFTFGPPLLDPNTGMQRPPRAPARSRSSDVRCECSPGKGGVRVVTRDWLAALAQPSGPPPQTGGRGERRGKGGGIRRASFLSCSHGRSHGRKSRRARAPSRRSMGQLRLGFGYGFGVWQRKQVFFDAKTLAPQLGQVQSPGRTSPMPPPPPPPMPPPPMAMPPPPIP